MAAMPSESQLDGIADALVNSGYVIVDDLMSQSLAMRLRDKAVTLSVAAMKPARIGRGFERHLDKDIRRDKIAWLDKQDATDSEFLALMNSLKDGLNRRLFMGLFFFESHFAHYPCGGFYKTHLDALKGSQNRILTTVTFFNPDWQPEHGGMLRLYDEHHQWLTDIAPLHGRTVIFLSEVFPHEVLPTTVDRFSIAGWYRVAAARHGI
ncbi:2OG-Fe(II) oxygenase [Shewanella sp. GXUN23E]|uniref:2OG-Fe(II) oxygenase n=1 Tax=Shewanella sp. GXUN23E TaxID=3422498 RepID=UPI003D7CAC5E